ncbi:hypothetical protein NECAME_05541 [Necator americanus]|uniref:NADP-dependent oxidoreductase domain-containing protein n=1 Tax=Necator americanus TaxID=51031 RepID=W2SIJ7_NECAM|nr:hypothetical protein NECAME_05541 [Necator americanus]ETN68577.1 hypothetical protein NECAME_05541 [Necator americanus]
MSSLKNVKGGAFKLNTGYYIPLFGFGTYTVTDKEVKHAVNEALACGYRLFDTARYYENEAELGEALEDRDQHEPKHLLRRTSGAETH